MAEATLRLEGASTVCLAGEWQLRSLPRPATVLQKKIEKLAANPGLRWDLSEMVSLDTATAVMLWRAWGHRLPAGLSARPELMRTFERVTAANAGVAPVTRPVDRLAWVVAIGMGLFALGRHLRDFVTMIGQLALDAAHVFRYPQDFPLREISANVYKAGVRALPVSALVGFLVGVTLSYLSALQLRNFGAEVYVINLLGIGVVRELGPVLVAVLIAGRSGSAMTAQIGTMRVTEEMDALGAMGVSRTIRLVMPKTIALALVMPMLVAWTSTLAVLGGMVVAQFQLDIGYEFFFETLPRVVPIANLWISLAKGVVFGALIGLVACHFGLRVEPNTESLAANTTRSVVTAITTVILADAVFAIVTREFGVPI